MKFEEVLPALREGKKIRRRGRSKSDYILIGTDDLVFDQDDEYFPFSLDDFLDDDWEIVEETKKVKLRDLTIEQYKKWFKNNCDTFGDCDGCPFSKVMCSNYEKKNDWWIENKDLYSNKFLDQEIEIDE